ncbi:MAG: hypothetical protein K9N49_03310 [Candidatus Marinimicrobia bacterium]|nr:hypothetical protein [Candidatus Neomarinimicrobiota bacterium]
MAERFVSGIRWGVWLLGSLALAGCATVPDEGDLPWNTPQTWEAAPSIPGMSDYR